jgi:hypothetical protein
MWRLIYSAHMASSPNLTHRRRNQQRSIDAGRRPSTAGLPRSEVCNLTCALSIDNNVSIHYIGTILDNEEERQRGRREMARAAENRRLGRTPHKSSLFSLLPGAAKPASKQPRRVKSTGRLTGHGTVSRRQTRHSTTGTSRPRAHASPPTRPPMRHNTGKSHDSSTSRAVDRPRRPHGGATGGHSGKLHRHASSRSAPPGIHHEPSRPSSKPAPPARHHSQHAPVRR